MKVQGEEEVPEINGHNRKLQTEMCFLWRLTVVAHQLSLQIVPEAGNGLDCVKGCFATASRDSREVI